VRGFNDISQIVGAIRRASTSSPPTPTRTCRRPATRLP
jgi:hypothetical protein